MDINYVHKINNVSTEEFETYQLQLKDKIDIRENESLEYIKAIAGIDIGYDITDDISKQRGHCSVIVFEYPSLKIIEKQEFSDLVDCDYVSGMLAKKELPLLLGALAKVNTDFDVLMVDGNGILHQLGIGSASHLSFFIDKPTIGVGKSFYNLNNQHYEKPGIKFGDYTEMFNKEGMPIGYAINTSRELKSNKPIFVSPGNRLSLKQAYDIVLNTTTKEAKLPYPVRMADIESRVIRERYKNEQ